MDTSSQDLLLAVKNGNFHMVEYTCTKHQFTNLCEIKGLTGEFELLKRENFNLSNWNPLLLSIAFDNTQSFKFFVKETVNHYRLALRAPPIQGFTKVQELSPQWSECFPILITLNNRNLELLKLLWEDLSKLWDSFHL